MHGLNWKKGVLTIPNFLSLFRLLLIPAYVSIYCNAAKQADYVLAAGILALSCFTDLIDGKIARKYCMVSTVGKILDPIADKLTQFSLILCLAFQRPVLWLVISLFVVKEFFQLVAGLINLRRRKILSGVLYSGKVCTTVLFISLIALVLFPDLSPSYVTVIAGVCTVVLIIAFADYVRVYLTNSPMIQDLDSGTSRK